MTIGPSANIPTGPIGGGWSLTQAELEEESVPQEGAVQMKLWVYFRPTKIVRRRPKEERFLRSGRIDENFAPEDAIVGENPRRVFRGVR